jgi:hypothetical protein
VRITEGYSSDGSHIKNLAYQLAAFDVGHVDWVVDGRDCFISQAGNYARLWKVIFDTFKGTESYAKRCNLLGQCYDHEIPLSLIRSGKVPISEDGHIIDLEGAQKLAVSKLNRHRTAAMKLQNRSTDRVKKRSKVVADGDV